MSNNIPNISAVIAAAGESSRMNLDTGESKQFINIGGKPVIERTLEIFNASPYICEIIISARVCDIDRIAEIAKAFDKVKIKDITAGGSTRAESVAGAAGRASCEYIAIHDGARCFVRLEDIAGVALRAYETGAAAAGCKLTDTIKRVENGVITDTLERGSLYAVQTPQVFLRKNYLHALNHIIKSEPGESGGLNAPDDCYIMERAGYSVSVVECSRYNIKLTDGQDLEFFNLS